MSFASAATNNEANSASRGGLGSERTKALIEAIGRGIGGSVRAVGVVEKATANVRDTVASATSMFGTILITLGLLALLVGAVLIAVFAMAFQEQRRQQEAYRSVGGAASSNSSALGWSLTAAVLALIGGLIWLLFGVAGVAVGAQAQSFAQRVRK